MGAGGVIRNGGFERDLKEWVRHLLYVGCGVTKFIFPLWRKGGKH